MIRIFLARHVARRGAITVKMILAVALLGLTCRSGEAQLTPEQLIGGAVSDSGPYYVDLSEAISRFRAGNFDGARALLNAARKKAPKLAPAEVMLAVMLSTSNQLAAARSELEKATAQHPEDPEAYLRLAEFDAVEGRTTEAGLMFGKAIEVADKFNESPKRKRAVQVRALTGGATLDETREAWAQARDKLLALLKLEPDNSAVHQRLAKALYSLGEPKEAYRELQAATAADTKSLTPEIRMAAFYNYDGDKTNAERWVAMAAKKGSGVFGAQYGLAGWYLEANDLDKALAHADAALKLEPQSVEAKLVRGLVARMQKDSKTAQAMLESAHLQSPTNSEVINQLALVLIEKPDESDHKRALEFAELFTRLQPNNLAAAGTMAWVQYRAGKLSEAERLFNAISTSGQQVSNDVVYYLARFYKDHGRMPEAERLLDALLSRGTNFYYRQQAQELQAEIAKRGPKGEKGDPESTAPKKPPVRKPAESK